MSNREKIFALRSFLKDTMRKEFDFSTTDQSRGLPPPPIQKPYGKGAILITLPDPHRSTTLGFMSVREAISRRRSRREYSSEPLLLDELSFLLWATQGVREIKRGQVYRTVPSAGNRHALETYIASTNVYGLKKGVYRYLPLDHKLVMEFEEERIGEKLARAMLGQRYPMNAAATFIWATVPQRMEWRYGEVSHKVIALDAGHVCQNLYLACESLGLGTVAVAAYDQEAMDELLRLDGMEEFVIYLAPVGRVHP
ncbi:MAG: SagB/ThcOx family dehydrogenase [Methanomassiliicoccales archaeon]